ncbi:MAG: zinc ABC transporter substrate-binding protein [Solirubrobacterales bacterium]
MSFKFRAAGFVVAIALASFIAGCGGSNDDAAKSNPPAVAAANSLLSSLVDSIGGSQIKLMPMAPGAINTHTWTPDTQAGNSMNAAKVIFRTGGDMEPWFESTYKMSGSTKPVVDLSKSVKLLSDGGHENSHWMTDIGNLRLAAKTIADELTKLNPGGAATYAANLKQFNENATTVDTSLKLCISEPKESSLRVAAWGPATTTSTTWHVVTASRSLRS